MSDKKYAILQISGGIGKHVAGTAVAKALKKNYPDRELIVVCAWPELFHNLDYIHRVYQLGNTQYFYETYIDGLDSEIFAQEPYYNTQHVNKKQSLIKTWIELYGMKYDGEMPELIINPAQKETISNFYRADKPILLIHCCGGLFTNEKPFCWQRDMPENVAKTVANHFRKTHQIIQVTRPKSYKLEDVFIRNEQVSQVELAGILGCVQKRLLIDSSMQHMAAAQGLRSTVLWNATSSTLFGYDMHDNIHAKEKPKKNMPNSYLFDFAFDGAEGEFPYSESDLKDLYNIDQIIASLEKQDKVESKGFGK